MTEDKFAENVIRELKKRSLMTYNLNKKKHRKFKKYFFRKAEKINWNKNKCELEFNKFSKAFNIKIIQ